MKVLNHKTKPKTFRKKVLSCDLLVMDLMSAALSGGLDEIDQVVKAVKEHHSTPTSFAKEQTLILVSSVMTWISTPKKQKKDYPSKVNDNGEPILREDESDNEGDNSKVLYFTDKDYQRRAPAPKYQQVKTIEMLAMAAQRASKNLKVYVVCSGLSYGNGESNDIFYEFFRSSWLSLHPDLASLPIVGHG